MNSTIAQRAGPTMVWLLVGSVFLATGFSTPAQGIQHLTITQPGGMPGLPLITGIERATNKVTVTWDGPSGYYQLYQKPTLSATNWLRVGGLSLTRRALLSASYSNAFFRVSGPQPQYAGSQVCLECHATIHRAELNTRHAGAFTNPQFVAEGGQTNSACLPCHTLGFGLPTGFVSKSKTPQLAGVQCENCHGPAANHAAAESNPVVKPRAELAGQVCGGCHTGSDHPTFGEWVTTGHASVVEDMNPAAHISSCGRCHSGSARIALLKGDNPSLAVTNDANVGIVCATCHDPHATHVWTNVLSGVVYTNQLRNPLSSTNDYFMATSDVFTKKYNPRINVCAQCHNHRGASSSSTTFPPHHSPQYNILLGTVGELPGGAPPNQPAAHALQIEKQCVGCHMPSRNYESEEHPALTGHQFKVTSFESCLQCHPLPDLLVDFTTFAVSNQIQQVKAALDVWATTKAPDALRAKYGVRAWEYTNPGALSNPAGVTNAGPALAEQGQIPVNIQKARFNLYLVFHDGSYGVHNAPYSITLLETALDWIEAALNP